MSGLKELWNLGEPSTLPPEVFVLVEPEKQAFLDEIARLNSSLRYTAANAIPSRHEDLSRRRDELLNEYQQIVTGRTAGPGSFEEILARTEVLTNEAGNLAQSVQQLKSRWEQQSPLLESTEDAVANVAETSDEAVAAQKSLLKAVEAAKNRDYLAACNELSSAASAANQLSVGDLASPAVPGSHVSERRFELKGGLAAMPEVPMDPEALANWRNPLIDGDPRKLFQTSRMDEVVDMHFQGEATAEYPDLNEAMKSILRAGPEADRDELLEHFEKIGELRGIQDPDGSVVSAQLDRYLQLKEVAGQLGEPDESWTSGREEYLQTYGDFLGTRNSLRFGQVVGEATGLDPAFAALLSPTGGMVGSGMDVLAPTDADTPVNRHGIFHDAGGYLLNCQNSGPGYSYLGPMQPHSGQPGEHPLQGQAEGISYWYERKAPERSVLDGIFLEPEFTAADPKHRLPVYERFTNHPVGDTERYADGLTDEAVAEVRELTRDTQRLSQQSFTELKAVSHEASLAVQKRVNGANQAVAAVATTARQLGVDKQVVDGTQQAIEGELQSVEAKVASWEQEVVADLEAASKTVEQSLQEIEQWAEEAAEFVKQTSGDYALDVKEAAKLKPFVQSKLVEEVGRRGANVIFGDTQGEIESLVDLAGHELKEARELVETFCDQALASADHQVDKAAAELAVVKDDLIGKLTEIQEQIEDVVKQVIRQVTSVEICLSNSGQDICDAAAGVEDSLSLAVAEGTDFLSHTLGSATEFAAERLASLTNLLG